MGSSDLVDIIRQGAGAWNQWMKDNPNGEWVGGELGWIVSLMSENLDNLDLSGANLECVDLHCASLRGTKLCGARLRSADLDHCKLEGADLRSSDLTGASMRNAQLQKASLWDAALRSVNLSGSNMEGVMLHGAVLQGTDLLGVNLTRARMSGTLFGAARIRRAHGLETCDHDGPSILDFRTLANSDPLPRVFLRGCGLTDWEIQYARLYEPNLSPEEIAELVTELHSLRADKPIQVRPVFLSYSHADSDFVQKLQDTLYDSGINTWRDVHDSTAGPLEEQLHNAMESRLVLVVLSSASTSSDWVEHEVTKARELAKKQRRNVLCPVALDDSWRTAAWSQVLLGQLRKLNILDFSDWRDEARFREQFRRLAAGIREWY